MSMIVMWFRKFWLIALVSALGLGSLPIANAFALQPSALTTPTPPPQQATDRLEGIWTKEQAINTKLGSFLNNSDSFISRIQGLINKAKANGKDTTTLQSDLDAFSVAIKQAEPIYQDAGVIVSSHQGFDDNGKVIDPVVARATVKSLMDKFIEIHQLLLNPRTTLQDALKAFREANKPNATPSPTQSSG